MRIFFWRKPSQQAQHNPMGEAKERAVQAMRNAADQSGDDDLKRELGALMAKFEPKETAQ